MSSFLKHLRPRRILTLTLSSMRVFFAIGIIALQGLAQPQKAPPPTRTDNVKDTLHGVEIVDPYRWLEDQNSLETRKWLDAQNDYTRSCLDALPGRDKIKQRLEELNRVDVIGLPFERNGRYFFSKRLGNQNQFVIYMRRGLKGEDEVLLDPHPMSPDQTVSVGLRDVARDGTILAYGVRRGGEDETTLQFLDVDTKTNLPDQFPRARYMGVSIKPDKSCFYYARYTPEGPRLYYHVMGTDPAGDTEIFGKAYGPENGIGTEISEDGRYLLIFVSFGSAGKKTEIYFQDLVNNGPILPIVNNIEARFSGDLAGDHLILHTNWNAAKGRVLDVDLKDPAREKWREIVPESDAVIGAMTLAGGKVCVLYLKNATSSVKIFDQSGKYVRDIAFETVGSVGALIGDWKKDQAFYTFASFHLPTTIYRYDVSTGSQEVWARQNVPIQSDKFDVKQVWYNSKDGTRIPMFLVHKKDLKLNGNNPTLLTGYGGFNISLTPSFSARTAYWIEQGGVFALPNLRGGGEFGEEWHRAGMFEKKQNVFDDFIAAAEWLIKNNYTNPSKLAISGGSNGGLLVGAALTQRPDLYQAVVCGYPLLDMVRYHKFLVAQFWVSEYGLADDPKLFRYIYKYSPYQHVVAAAKYPALLMISGDLDTRVDPLHARKMTALLQASTSSERPVVLKYNTKAGHSGGLPLSQVIDDLTDEMSFLFWQLGVASLPPDKPGGN